mmetsp:Transcript_16684/g.41059  ORF Transcript_16684/g.41059 Transcript_16684/m.41059 type:complete len:319 (-) Transcript_16684:238-1194(-)
MATAAVMNVGTGAPRPRRGFAKLGMRRRGGDAHGARGALLRADAGRDGESCVDKATSLRDGDGKNPNDEATMGMALKEWGTAVAALAAGHQTVIFRKGGLRDGGGSGGANRGFRLEHTSFALFPTVYHPKENAGAHEASAVAARRPGMETFVNDDAIPDMKKGESVNITVTAQVTGAWVTHDPAVLDVLHAHHMWTGAELASRMAWKPDTPITVLELRVRVLPLDAPSLPVPPVSSSQDVNKAAAAAAAAAVAGAASQRTLPPDLKRYGGCKSWVVLPFEIAADAGVPALSDDVFRARGLALRAALLTIAHAPLALDV